MWKLRSGIPATRKSLVKRHQCSRVKVHHLSTVGLVTSMSDAHTDEEEVSEDWFSHFSSMQYGDGLPAPVTVS